MLRIKNANFQKSKMVAAAILKFEKVNSFLRDKAIFTTFQQHTPGTNQYRSLWSKIIIFQIQDGGDTILDFEKCQYFRIDEAILTKYQQHPLAETMQYRFFG